MTVQSTAFFIPLEPSSSMHYAFITCLDSTTNIESIIKRDSVLKPLEKEGRIIGESLLITTKKLLEAERDERIFFGFDEIWFSASPKFVPKPQGFWLNGPTEFHQQIPDELIRWIQKGNYALGLGDGTGLNYVGKVRSIIGRCLISAYNETGEKKAA